MSKTPITPVHKRFSLGSIAFAAIMFPLLLTACGGGKDNGDGSGSGGGTTEFTVNTTAGSGGGIDPSSATVASGDTASFTVTPDSGYAFDTVSGCGGSLSGNTYTTGAITADCTVSASFVLLPPASAAVPTLSFTRVKLFRFSWTDVATATFYRLLENPDGASGFSQVGADIPAGTQQYDHEVPLYARVNARYILQSCNAAGCTDSAEISVSDNLAAAVGYFKASNTEAGDRFGYSVALSGDGNTLAVGAPLASSASGVVYIFVRSGTAWLQQAFFNSPNTEIGDLFGYSVALSADGNTLAVGAPLESSVANMSGAVFVFSRAGAAWSQQTIIKAPNAALPTGSLASLYGDNFGTAIALSADGNTLAVGAPYEDNNATGTSASVGSDNDDADDAGAAYVFTRSGTDWSLEAYVKASNTGDGDRFGSSLAFSDNGNTLAVGALTEDTTALDSGAVYIFTRSGTDWNQQDFIKASSPAENDWFGYAVALSSDGNTLAVGSTGKASNPGSVYVLTRSGAGNWDEQSVIEASNVEADDEFGAAVALSADGNTLVVGARGEDSAARGINGNESDDTGADDSGAAYVFTRSDSNWSQQAYVKASNTDAGDRFGTAVALSADGNTLAVGARGEASAATGVGGNQSDDSASNAGAVYLY